MRHGGGMGLERECPAVRRTCVVMIAPLLCALHADAPVD